MGSEGDRRDLYLQNYYLQRIVLRSKFPTSSLEILTPSETPTEVGKNFNFFNIFFGTQGDISFKCPRREGLPGRRLSSRLPQGRCEFKLIYL